jgi:hypothetical protein
MAGAGLPVDILLDRGLQGRHVVAADFFEGLHGLGVE